MLNSKPALLDYAKAKPLFTNDKMLTYTVNPNKGMTKATEVYFRKDELELEDGLVGMIDTTENYFFLNSLDYAHEFYKPQGSDFYNKDYPPMIYYWNFVLVHEGLLHQRIRYGLFQILEQVGGVYSALIALLTMFFSLYTYKKDSAIVYREF